MSYSILIFRPKERKCGSHKDCPENQVVEAVDDVLVAAGKRMLPRIKNKNETERVLIVREPRTFGGRERKGACQLRLEEEDILDWKKKNTF